MTTTQTVKCFFCLKDLDVSFNVLNKPAEKKEDIPAVTVYPTSLGDYSKGTGKPLICYICKDCATARWEKFKYIVPTLEELLNYVNN